MHNFDLALPAHLAEQAEESLKSAYNLEFLGIARPIKEQELEERLIDAGGKPNIDTGGEFESPRINVETFLIVLDPTARHQLQRVE